VVRKKFSATNFWKDCTEHKATVVQYIGELCRYLVNTPQSQYDSAHNVRMAVGNGMRPEVWGPFQDRFKVPQIAEFYASTEGNATLLNSENKFGAVGFISPLVQTKCVGERMEKRARATKRQRETDLNVSASLS
jgi:acyl-CoA synthetase (AMP-forming)/AMP-acid ligase II